LKDRWSDHYVQVVESDDRLNILVEKSMHRKWWMRQVEVQTATAVLCMKMDQKILNAC